MAARSRSSATALILALASAAAASGPLQAHVTLLAPNGGEILQVRSIVTIRWQVAIPHNTQDWDLFYSTTGSNGPWIPIVMNLPPGNISRGAIHTFDWKVPATISKNVRVRVRMDNSGQDYDDISDGDLTIEARPSYTRFGSGCAGSAGVPVLDAAANSLPRIRETFTIELTNLPAGGNGAVVLTGVSKTAPLDLGPIGMTGCSSLVSFEVLSGTIPTGNGMGKLSFAIPDATALLGAPFFNQAVVLDPGAGHPLGAVMTNAAMGVIGAR